MFASDLLIQLQDILIKLAADLSVPCYKFQTNTQIFQHSSHNLCSKRTTCYLQIEL